MINLFDVGILTWYKSLNHGAVLQAYSSQKFLEKNGFNSILLDYDRNVNVMETSKDKIKRRLSYLNLNHLNMKLKEKTIEHLKVYRASVEVYGTASELYDLEMRINELEGNH